VNLFIDKHSEILDRLLVVTSPFNQNYQKIDVIVIPLTVVSAQNGDIVLQGFYNVELYNQSLHLSILNVFISYLLFEQLNFANDSLRQLLYLQYIVFFLV
jgi:hypothetical protein